MCYRNIIQVKIRVRFTIVYLTWNIFKLYPISTEKVKTTMALPARGQALACKIEFSLDMQIFKVILPHSEVSAVYTQLTKNSHCAHRDWVYIWARGQRPQLRFNRKTACQHVGLPVELSQWKQSCIIPCTGACVGHFACSTARSLLSLTDFIATTTVCGVQ